MERTYLITAATGIGAETARELVRSRAAGDGVNVFFSSLTEEPCAAFAEELRGMGAQAEWLAGDLTDAAFAPALVRGCVERFGRIDGLFNVAGISGRKFGDGPVHACTEEAWRITLDTNLTTQYRMCREALSVMRAQEVVDGARGAVLNMSSILALHPEAEHFDTVAYAVSKGGVLSLTRSMAASYAGEKIRVNAVAPALVHTAMSARTAEKPAVLEYVRGRQPLTDGVMPATSVAEPCAFLLSAASRAITGQVLEIDAGWSLF